MSLIPLNWLTGRKARKGNHPRSSRPSGEAKSATVQHNSVKEASRSESAVASQPFPGTTLKVTDTAELERHIQLEKMPPERSLELFCPIHSARIFCRSILVDKLGGLTKFIVVSLHEGHTIEEISNLTKMGEVTIQKEVDYLISVGLLSARDMTLTSDGHQYGDLLVAFNDLSGGIEAYFNEFANLFELNEPELVEVPNPGEVIKGNWIPALSRNENYKNSLTIAKDAIGPGIPFASEIRDSLYTTVRIDSEVVGYKKMRVKDLGKETRHVDEPCVGVSIPFARISYRPKYSWVNPYRDSLDALRTVGKEHAEDLLTDLARRLLVAANEEESADALRIDIDEITGAVRRADIATSRLPEATTLIMMEGNAPLQAMLDPDECEGLFLEEAEREELHRIAFFSYEDMEDC